MSEREREGDGIEEGRERGRRIRRNQEADVLYVLSCECIFVKYILVKI